MYIYEYRRVNTCACIFILHTCTWRLYVRVFVHIHMSIINAVVFPTDILNVDYTYVKIHMCLYVNIYVSFQLDRPVCVLSCSMHTQYRLSLSFSEEAHNLRANTCTPTFEHIHFTCISTDVYAWWWFVFLAGTARFSEAHMTSQYTYIHVRTNMCGVDVPLCRLRTTCGAINIPLNTQKYHTHVSSMTILLKIHDEIV